MIGSIDAGISSFSHGVKHGGGVYFLWSEHTCVYAGQSVNILKRICEHTADKLFDRSTYEPIVNNDMTFVESYAIWFLRPRYNKHVPLLGSLGCNYSGKLKKRSIKFVCRLIVESATTGKIADLFAEADEILRCNADKTSSLHYKKALIKQANRNWRVRNLVLHGKEAAYGPHP